MCLLIHGKPLPREKSKRTLEIELSLVIGQSYNQCYASEHCMGKLCLCGVGLLIATVRNTTEETIILWLWLPSFFEKINDSGQLEFLMYYHSTSLRSVHTRRQVAATCRGDTLQRQIASYVLENFCENLCRCNRICRRNKSHRFSLIWFFATCCSDKILLRRQIFSQRFSSTHEAICRCDVSPHLVAATSRPICTHGVICRRDVLQQLVA